jgi:hypothetical protein
MPRKINYELVVKHGPYMCMYIHKNSYFAHAEIIDRNLTTVRIVSFLSTMN